MKSECMGQKIDRLLKAGMATGKIAAKLGCDYNYVCVIKSHGGWENRKQAMREQGERIRRARGIAPRSQWISMAREQRQKTVEPIIAAVESGMTYKAVAEKFGLASRNVVAGIMHRHADP